MKFKTFIKKPRNIIIIAVVLLLVFLGYSMIFSKKNTGPSNVYTVTKGDVVQEVSVSGKVKPAEAVDLAFEKGGRISRINVAVGDKVSSGEVLASVYSGDTAAQLAQAQAQLDVQRAQLDALKKGTRPEEIQITASDLAKAQSDLDNIYNNVPTVLNDAYSKSDDAVRNQLSAMFSNAETDYPTLSFTTTNAQSSINAQNERLVVKSELKSWQSELDSLQSNSSSDSIDQAISSSKKHLSTVTDLLNQVADALTGASSLSPTTLATYKANLSTARTEVNLATGNINTQKQTVDAQKLAITKIQNQLALQKAGSTVEQISAQEAQVRQAEANVMNYQAQLEKTVIRAPIDGVVTKQDSEVGQIINPSVSFISLISQAQFEMEANIPEADIAKVKVGDDANVTLDAYGNDVVFNAKVTKIDPAETIIEGVATYKTTLHFTNSDDRIKSGMTANITISAANKPNVIIIPQRSIIEENNKKFVNLLNSDGKTTRKVEIVIGLRGTDGNVEVISGLNPEDKIVTFLQGQ